MPPLMRLGLDDQREEILGLAVEAAAAGAHPCRERVPARREHVFEGKAGDRAVASRVAATAARPVVGGRDEDRVPHLVAEGDRQDRVLNGARELDFEAGMDLFALTRAHELLAGPGLAPAANEPHGASGRRLLLAAAHLTEVDLVVGACDPLGLALVDQPPALEHEAVVAEAFDARHVVRHVEHRPVLALQAVELVEALLLEGCVADGQHLVDEQHVGLDLNRDGEAQPHAHPR